MQFKARSKDAEQYRKLYNTKAWRILRIAIIQRDSFTCQTCGLMDHNPSRLVANHIKPHKGDMTLFSDPANIQCTCKPCHDKHIQSMERGGRGKPVIGLDGWPAH